MKISPGLGLIISLLLFAALYLLVPGYAEWLNELVAP